MCQSSPRDGTSLNRAKKVPPAGASPERKMPTTEESAAAETLPKPYRLHKIQIKRSCAIDQIKFVYDDESEWFAGHDGGKADRREAIMTKGEHLVCVTHEKFKNYRCAGAGVEFETSLGRVFKYQPARMATKLECEQTTLRAAPGHEIIGLVIRQGVLHGIKEQPLPAPERAAATAAAADGGSGSGPARPWFVVASVRQKEDSAEAGGGDSDEPAYRHFHERAAALAHWDGEAAPGARGKQGRGAVLVDVLHMQTLQSVGAEESVALCTERAMAAGFVCHAEEENVSVVGTVLMLVKLLGHKDDLWRFGVVTTLLLVSSYLELYGKMLTGLVLTMVTESNSTTLLENYATRATCDYVMGQGGCPVDDVVSVRKAAALAFVLVQMVQKLIYVLNVYIHHNACDAKNTQMRRSVFEHVMHLDQAYFDKHTIAEIRGGMNVNSLSNLISWNVPYLVMKSCKVVMVVAFMLRINVVLAAICIASVALVKFGVLDPVERRELVHHKVQRKLDTMNNQVVDECFGMVSSIKLFGQQQRHVEEYNEGCQQYADNINATVVMRCLREFGFGNLRVVTFGAVLFYGLRQVAEAGLQPAELTAFFLIFNDLQELIQSFKWHMEVLVREFPDIDRFLTLMKQKPSIVSGTHVLGEVSGEVEFRDVTFEYPTRPGERSLKGISLAIQPRKMTAIVGESGGGKSTLTKLLMRLYDPQQGAVLLDGHDLRTLSSQSISEHIAIVPQNPDLFNASIADNIAYGAVGGKEPSREAIEAAAKLANCHGFISSFRGGFDTFAGPGGGQLSGGQKQRIAIARAAIRNPAILILDEATSALDAANERLVQEALNNVMAGRTTVVIAHRLSTIMGADEIICMKDGEVAEQGSHEELMARRGRYYNLVSKQIFEKRAEEGGGEEEP